MATRQDWLLTTSAGTRIASGADVASAYTLAAIASFVFDNPITSSPLDLLIVGTFITSLLAIAQPIERISAKRLASHLEGSGFSELANYVLGKVAPKTEAWEQNVLSKPETRKEFLRSRSRRAFWQQYLAKERARLTGGSLVMVTLGLLSLYLFLVEPTWVRIMFAGLGSLAAVVIGWSLRKKLRDKIPEYCWAVCSYGLVAEFATKNEQNTRLIDRVRRLLIDEEWDEAGQWLREFAPY